MKIDGQTATHWFDLNSDAEGIVTAFTASVENALLAWPDNLRPATWTSTPIACCVAALAAIRDQLPRVEHRATPDHAG